MPTTDQKPQIASAGEPSKAARLTGNLLYLAAAVCAGGLFYLGWLLIVGRFSPPAYPTGAERAALQHLLDNAGLAFVIGLWAMLFLIIIRWPAAEIFGWVVLAVGTLLYLGIAAILLKLAPNIDLNGIESPGRALFLLLRTHSSGMICLGALRIIIGEIMHFAGGESAGATVKTRKGEAHTLSRQCWELAFCRSALKEHCPRFRSHIACWRAKSGCYCDGEIASALILEKERARAHGAPDPAAQASQRPQETRALHAKASMQRDRPPCVSCVIYREHQRYKYKIAAWVIFPLSAFITWLISDAVRTAWLQMDKLLSSQLAHVDILGTPAGPGLIDLTGTLDLSWTIVVFVCFLIISIAMNTAEWLLFKVGV